VGFGRLNLQSVTNSTDKLLLALRMLPQSVMLLLLLL
jgi:hypothetical protein